MLGGRRGVCAAGFRTAGKWAYGVLTVRDRIGRRIRRAADQVTQLRATARHPSTGALGALTGKLRIALSGPTLPGQERKGSRIPEPASLLAGADLSHRRPAGAGRW